MDPPGAARRPRPVESPRVASEGAAPTSDLATLLKGFRVRAGLSQQMLADRAQISVQAVSALERGYRKVPYRKTLEQIADALALPEEARAALEFSARRARGSRLADHEGAPGHNLPRQLTSFFGRTEVVAEIADLVETAPLVTIVGTGGAGKTRVAVAVGTALLNRFPDGVWFVELAPLSDPALVSGALAATLRVQESPNRPAGRNAALILERQAHVDRLRQLRARYFGGAQSRRFAAA